MSDEMEELKRCPFCGGTADAVRIAYRPDEVTNEKWIVGCDGKFGSLCPGYIYKCSPIYVTRAMAVRHWNARNGRGLKI